MPESAARKPDGVVWEDGCWTAYLNNVTVASGPDKPIIQAAYDFHASADEFRSAPDDAIE